MRLRVHLKMASHLVTSPLIQLRRQQLIHCSAWCLLLLLLRGVLLRDALSSLCAQTDACSQTQKPAVLCQALRLAAAARLAMLYHPLGTPLRTELWLPLDSMLSRPLSLERCDRSRRRGNGRCGNAARSCARGASRSGGASGRLRGLTTEREFAKAKQTLQQQQRGRLRDRPLLWPRRIRSKQATSSHR